jgi:hypothetical protein
VHNSAGLWVHGLLFVGFRCLCVRTFEDLQYDCVAYKIHTPPHSLLRPTHVRRSLVSVAPPARAP